MSVSGSMTSICVGLAALMATTSCAAGTPSTSTLSALAAPAAASPATLSPTGSTGGTSSETSTAQRAAASTECAPPPLTRLPAQSFTRPQLGPGTARPQDRARLEALVVCPRVKRVRGTVPGYNRKLFGPRWKDVDRNGCRQRPDVLWRDLDRTQPYTLKPGRCPHDVATGSWIDPYSGDRLTASLPGQVSTLIAIDHAGVSLQEAFESGADRWTPQQRLAFANWLPNLVPTLASRNSSKGDRDAAAWRPKKAKQCTFGQLIIDTKYTWNLSIDPSEKKALNELLSTCPPPR